MNSAPRPPRLASWCISRLRLQGDGDALLGDLEEEFNHILGTRGAGSARLWYIRQVLVSLPGFFDQMLHWSFSMLKNYLKVAVRSFRNQPVYSLINVVGLAIGVACCILLFLFVQDELTFDSFHTRADRIYRLERIQEVNSARSSFTDGATGPALVRAYPEVEAATRTFRVKSLVGVDNRRFFGEEIAYVDPDFLQIFSFQLLRGEDERALAVTNSIVLTQSMATKYFGQKDPVGKTVRIDNEMDLLVTGVVEDVPHNSHYRFDALASFSSLIPERPWLERFGAIAVRTYLLLAPNADPAELEAKFGTFIEEHPTFSEAFILRPLGEIHLRSNVWEIDPQGDMKSVFLLAAVALAILLLACVNYVNLATARSTKRMREVGLRKVLGADRVQLVLQFLGESVVLTLGAVGLALGLVVAALPTLNAFVGRDLSLAPLLARSGFLLAVYVLLLGLLAGSYPAVYLARFKPVNVLKGAASSVQGSRVRRVLVVTQFVVSIVLLAATLVAGLQLRYMQEKNLGFDDNNVVNILLRDGQLVEKAELLKQELLADSQVSNVSLSSTGVDEFSVSGPVFRPDSVDFGGEVLAGLVHVDEDYLNTFRMQLVAGQDFSNQRSSSSSQELLVNESLVRALGWDASDMAVGQRLGSSGWLADGTIVGVVKDFHIRPLTSGIPPVLMVNAPRLEDGMLSVRLQAGDSGQALIRFKALWDQVNTGWPFEAAFLDEAVQQRYEQNRRQSQLFLVFSSLAILIACLGLFGLATFMGQQRTKEIAIRKIMGASEFGMVLLLSREFTFLVSIAFALAAPIAYVLMDQWLGAFAYHVALRWYFFAAAGAVVLVIAWLTVSVQSIQMARISAEKMLRYD
jgi:putative ABC transport system permease protein